MASVTETIDKALANHDEFSPEQKKSLKEVLVKVLEGGEVPFEAMGIDKDMIEATYALAYHNYQMGQFEDASAIFDMLYTFTPLDERILLGSAACFHQLGQFEKAIERYLMIISIDDETPLPYFYATDCYLKMDEKLIALIYTDITLRKAKERPNLFEQIINWAELTRNKLCEDLEIDPESLDGPSVFEELEAMDIDQLEADVMATAGKKVIRKKIIRKKVKKSPQGET